MKIGVITFFQSQNNYGQLLQAWALQQVLRREGHRPEVIRYCFERPLPHWLRLSTYMKKGRRDELRRQRELARMAKEKLRADDRHFDRFRADSLRLSRRHYNNLQELRKRPPQCDAYICGSDQVWAQFVSHYDNRTFFLDFGPYSVRRIAYAPSFAVNEYPAELHNDLRQLLARFTAISAREQTGVDICRRLGFTDAQLVLDPTLLLDGGSYATIRTHMDAGTFCFVYQVNIREAEDIHWTAFRKYNESQGMKTLATYANPYDDMDMKILDGAEYVYPAIGEWLGYVCQARYVLTSSFHGVALSIVHHTPFVACLRRESAFAGNDRITTLLRNLGLESRIVRHGETVDPAAILAQRIDWDDVDRRLDQLREHSLRYLTDALASVQVSQAKLVSEK